jgi:hypothetical protein
LFLVLFQQKRANITTPIVICALQEHLYVIQGYKAGARQLLQQRLQAVQRMRAVLELEWGEVPVLRQDFADKAAQHTAQSKDEKLLEYSRALGQQRRSKRS